MIKLENITKHYKTLQGSRVVLDNVNLVIEPGEKVGILGANGAGKSTLVRIISGAEMPTSGNIHRNMYVSWPLAFSGSFQGSLTGLDNIRFITRVYDIPFRDTLSFVEGFAELGSYLKEPVKVYSSGMRARLAFGISLAVDFDCYLIDEIIVVGDKNFQDKCRVELYQKRKDKAKVIVTHNTSYLRQHCNTHCVLHNGKLTKFSSFAEAEGYYKEVSTKYI